jgi:hypothetical protein
MIIEMPYGKVEINSKEDAVYFIKNRVAIIVRILMKCGLVRVIKHNYAKKKKRRYYKC